VSGLYYFECGVVCCGARHQSPYVTGFVLFHHASLADGLPSED